MKRRTQIVYEVDGKTYSTKREAAIAEATSNLDGWLDRHGAGRTGDWTADEFRDLLLREADWALVDTLSALLRLQSPKPSGAPT